MILTLTKLWINRLDNGTSISAPSSSDSGDATWDNPGEVRLYASGRRRGVMIQGEGGTVPFTLLEVSSATVATLRTWKGINVQVRDWRGRKWFGVFFSVTETPARGYPDIYKASFTLQTTTTSEGV